MTIKLSNIAKVLLHEYEPAIAGTLTISIASIEDALVQLSADEFALIIGREILLQIAERDVL